MAIVGARHGARETPVREASVVPAPEARRGRPPGAERLARWLWYDRTVKWQLLATFVVINLVTGIGGGVVVIYNAHEATAAEVAASMEVARQVASRAADRLGLANSSAQPSRAGPSHPNLALHALRSLPERLRHLRHVRISIADASGRVLAPSNDAGSRESGHMQAPAWFAALFHVSRQTYEIPVTLSGRHVGTVLVTSQPADEIAEVWRDVSDLAVVVLIANTVVIGLFYLALRRILTPLTSLATGLRELEEGRFRHRLPRPRVRELTDIADRFNALAGALETARGDNARLNRRLVRVQDDERRQIATELHDELGACLFGLRANVLSVQRLADSLPPGVAEPLRRRAETLMEVSERIQTTNRRVLRRVRPMAIGHAALADVLAALVADFERNGPDQAFTLDIGRLRHGYGDSIDLTVYRCLQEGLTNVMRHAGARTVAISVEEVTTPAGDVETGAAPVWLRLSVRDDGRGIAPGTSPGLGLTGMEERVNALGGTFTISNRPAGGTSLDIAIPVEGAEPETSHRADIGNGQHQ